MKGEVVQRAVTIKEEAKGGWWKQHNQTNSANTIIPPLLCFRLPDDDQGDA